MFKTLDRYILRKFLTTFFFIIGLFILIAVIFDVSEKTDNFLEPDIKMEEIIFDYYFSFIPWLYGLLSPIIVFLAVIFFTSSMAQKTEIIPMLSAGMSFKRILVPYGIGALFLFSISLFLNHFVIPQTNKDRIKFEARIWHSSNLPDNTKIHREIEPNKYIFFNSYAKSSDIGYHFRLDHIENKELKFRMYASYLKWLHEDSVWQANQWFIMELKGDSMVTREGVSMDTTFNFDYSEFHKRTNIIETMDYFEISDYIEEERARGSKLVKRYELEQVKRTATPFSIIILTFIGACIASRKIKGGMGMHIVYGLALATFYIFVQRMAEVFAQNTPISADLAVWMPNIVFGVIAILLYRNAPK